ncbi:phosphatidylserine decarboxylase [Aspergillus brunneoviolaceus CBS 621.78]|uniref:Phosphatidylserine decarboxylase n=1 Tax=Aspergillus brunneoviolaceus CBS 621.78 TaxID=1450534 RepID=A0ACD1GEK3_9EURO|nr:phosphatidylserine decarboxylase [Aspergillus brunneoviolaceus CBS 621.78]RAH47745.1 phosphatidylserine decarboxylase [Aspergillus brunneoviolaceus CBS 621.78]
MDFLKSTATLPKVTLPDLGQLTSGTVKDFRALIQNDPTLLKNATAMFIQAGSDPLSVTQNLAGFLVNLDKITRTAPAYDASAAKNSLGGSMGILTNLLEPYLKTAAGQEFFRDARVDKVLQSLLKEWTVYLKSPESASVLTDDDGGWFSRAALSDEERTTMFQDYQCDPEAPHYGFQSWDQFFTREFRASARPVAAPDDDNIITAACESTQVVFQPDVQLSDTFNIKDHKYSLSTMFGDQELAGKFGGGRLYQGALNPTNYHRWHAPVSGTISTMQVIAGTFFNSGMNAAFDASPVTAVIENEVGAALHEATRCVIVIDNAKLGPVACVFAGMRERGSCEPTVRAGDEVSKGDQIGMFHFGGSTHCLVFNRNINFSVLSEGAVQSGQTVAVNSQLFTVS